MLELVELEPDIYLDEIVDKLQEVKNVSVSLSTVQQTLKKLGITSKKVLWSLIPQIPSDFCLAIKSRCRTVFRTSPSIPIWNRQRRSQQACLWGWERSQSAHHLPFDGAIIQGWKGVYESIFSTWYSVSMFGLWSNTCTKKNTKILRASGLISRWLHSLPNSSRLLQWRHVQTLASGSPWGHESLPAATKCPCHGQLRDSPGWGSARDVWQAVCHWGPFSHVQ